MRTSLPVPDFPRGTLLMALGALVVGALLLLPGPSAAGSMGRASTVASVAPSVTGTGGWTQFHGSPDLDGVSGAGIAPSNATLFPHVDLTQYTGAFGSVTSNGLPYQASPASDGHTVVVALGNYVLSLYANNGTPSWRLPFAALPGGSGGGPVVTTPLLAQGMVYVAQDGGSDLLVALDANNGTQAWSVAAPPCNFCSRSITSSIVEGAGQLAAATLGGAVGYHLPSPGFAWTSVTTSGGPVFTATPAYVYVAGVDESAFVLPSIFGSLEGYVAPPVGGDLPGFPAQPPGGFGEVLTSSAAVVNLTDAGTTNTFAFFGGDAGGGSSSHLWAVDLTDPAIIFRYAVPPLGGGSDGIYGTPAVVPSSTQVNQTSIYFGTRDDQAMGITFAWGGGAAGRFSPAWSYQGLGSFYASPAVGGAEVLLASADTAGTVEALSTSNGDLLWNAHTGSPVYASPCIVGGAAFVVSSAGLLYAFGTSPSNTGGGSPGGSGSTNGSGLVYTVLAVVVLLAVVAILLFLFLGRRRHPSPPPGGVYPPPPGAATQGPSSFPPPPPAGTSSWAPPPPPPAGAAPRAGHGGSAGRVPPPPTTADLSSEES